MHSTSFLPGFSDDIFKSPDIKCLGGGGTICNEAEWKDPNMSGRKLNNQISDKPVLKDTVMVPSGGYTVIRFKANNPGLVYFNFNIFITFLQQVYTLFGFVLPASTIIQFRDFQIFGSQQLKTSINRLYCHFEIS